MFWKTIQWVEDELAKFGVTTALFKTVAAGVVADLLAGKDANAIVNDVLDLLRNRQISTP